MNALRAEMIIDHMQTFQVEIESRDNFIKRLKKRLRLYTGNDAVAFYNEIQVAQLLIDLQVLDSTDKKCLQ